ncbi:MAG: DUF1080 domain-containing protein [Bryobacteraceae bacterium]
MLDPRLVLAAVLAGFVALAGCAADSHAQEKGKKKSNRTTPVGYDDTPFLPDGKWRVHDIKRPHPRIVTPGAEPGRPPSDAIVLFDGKDLSQWASYGPGRERRQVVPAGWKVENGYMEIAPKSGGIFTKEKFGNCQLHLEWASPAGIDGSSQMRGNSGVLLMNLYEIQVLDSYRNLTYADGQAASIYGQYPPLVNASRKPGEWQTYDIVFEAPHFEGDKLTRPAYATVFHNGVLVHHRKEIVGRMAHKVVGTYAPHGPEEPLGLQDHDVPVRYRNIWMRRLKGYDEPSGS